MIFGRQFKMNIDFSSQLTRGLPMFAGIHLDLIME